MGGQSERYLGGLAGKREPMSQRARSGSMRHRSSTNPILPVKPFPTLTASPATFPVDTLSAGKSISLTYSNSTSTGQNLVMLHGLNVTSVAIENGKASLPAGLQGTVYAVVSKDQTANDESVVAGPIILTFPFSSSASN